MTLRPALRLPTRLRDEIHDCGYFPELVSDAIALALGTEEPIAHLVHQEATFNSEELQRHLSVLVLTPSRLLVGHTDENDSGEGGLQALTTTESIPLREVNSVALSQVVANPAGYATSNRQIGEAWLTVTWGTMRRIDLEPAHCQDPQCEADHGMTGMLAGDDLTIRISLAGDGARKVDQLIGFATELQSATGHA